MIIFFGIRQKKIRHTYDEKEPCTLCNSYRRQYIIYQPYFHIFFIPFFPVGKKYLVTTCHDCSMSYRQEYDLRINATRTPLYMFSGLLLIAALFMFSFVNHFVEGNKYEEYVQDPQPGDIYLIKNKTEGEKYYYFIKIQDAEADSLNILMGAYEYKRYVSRMDREDYFVTDYYYSIHRDKPKEWLKDRTIRTIIRQAPEIPAP